MSRKSNFIPGKRVSLKEQAKPSPRTLEEINKSYSEELAKAGQTQYLVYVYTNELESANKRLLSLNQEAAARNELEKQKPAPPVAEPKQEETVNEQA